MVQGEKCALACPARILTLGLNGVRVILIHMYSKGRRSLPRLNTIEWFIVERAASQLKGEQTKVNMYNHHGIGT